MRAPTLSPERSTVPVIRSPYLTIQALRFFAAFAVVVLHSGFYTAERLDGGFGYWTQGANGVRLFFVISGFVMIMAADDRLTAPGGWSVFSVKRIIRVVPMYWAATAFKLFTMFVAPGTVLHARLDWSYVAKSLLFLPAYNVDGEIHPLLGVGWTLTFEMFFYAMFALALVFRANPVRFLTPVLGVLALLSFFRTPGWPVALQCWADPIVLDFLGGMLLARWCQGGHAAPPALAAAMMTIGIVYLFVPLGGLRPAFGSFHGSGLTTLAAVLVLAGAVSLESLLGPHIPRPILFMGGASYALYLIHPLIAPAVPVALHKLGLIWPHVSVVVAVGLAIAAGGFCHLLIERPSTRFLTGWAKRVRLLDPSASLPGQAALSDDDLLPPFDGGAPREPRR
jgi:peptidoglycan/LPS O-acetylase OafA/YrhL